MKNTKSTIPLKQREEMKNDPFYSTCAMYGQFDHQCDGRITWEHAIRVAGKSCQAKWSIVPLCAKAHDVDQFQDSHEMKKELNEWIALSRANPSDIMDLFLEKQESPLGKSKFLLQQRKYLISKYGEYTYKSPAPKTLEQSFIKDMLAVTRIASSFNIEIKEIQSARLNGRTSFMGIECNRN